MIDQSGKMKKSTQNQYSNKELASVWRTNKYKSSLCLLSLEEKWLPKKWNIFYSISACKWHSILNQLILFEGKRPIWIASMLFYFAIIRWSIDGLCDQSRKYLWNWFPVRFENKASTASWKRKITKFQNKGRKYKVSWQKNYFTDGSGSYKLLCPGSR